MTLEEIIENSSSTQLLKYVLDIEDVIDFLAKEDSKFGESNYEDTCYFLDALAQYLKMQSYLKKKGK